MEKVSKTRKIKKKNIYIYINNQIYYKKRDIGYNVTKEKSRNK